MIIYLFVRFCVCFVVLLFFTARYVVLVCTYDSSRRTVILIGLEDYFNPHPQLNNLNLTVETKSEVFDEIDER